MTLSLFDKPKTKSERVLEALQKAGGRGITNIALNHITFRYGAVIHRLRLEGHDILTGKTDKYGKVIYYYYGRKI